jgi:hypothetical protein
MDRLRLERALLSDAGPRSLPLIQTFPQGKTTTVSRAGRGSTAVGCAASSASTMGAAAARSSRSAASPSSELPSRSFAPVSVWVSASTALGRVPSLGPALRAAPGSTRSRTEWGSTGNRWGAAGPLNSGSACFGDGVGGRSSCRQSQGVFRADPVLRGAAFRDELPDLSTRARRQRVLVEQVDQRGGAVGSLVAVGTEQAFDHIAQPRGRVRCKLMQRGMIA